MPIARLRESAVKHLKIAAAQLPDIAEAQARYGVALVLAGEQNLGRQFLQTALRLGSLDPQFQLWAAWAILQAGYPEEAEPIVAALLRQVAAGNAPRELEAGLYLLSGEIHQSRRTPDDLNKAVGFFEKALATGRETSANVVFRLAQIDVQIGTVRSGPGPDRCLENSRDGKPGRRAARRLDARATRQERRRPVAASSGAVPSIPTEPIWPASMPPCSPRMASPPRPIASWPTSLPVNPITRRWS